MSAALTLIARICLSAIFLGAGVNKILDIESTVLAMQNAGIPYPNMLVWGAIVFLILGGLSVAAGCFTRLGTLMLMIFLGMATYYFHPFWKADDLTKMDQMIAFQKNLGLFGGLLFLFANGPGPASFDGRRIVREEVVVEKTVVAD